MNKDINHHDYVIHKNEEFPHAYLWCCNVASICGCISFLACAIFFLNAETLFFFVMLVLWLVQVEEPFEEPFLTLFASRLWA